MKKGAYGVVYQDVTRDSSLPLAVKGLYAYLAAFCGTDDECYPSVDTILRETGVSKETFYKYINVLVKMGVVKKQQINKNGRFGKTVYKLTHEITRSDLPYTIFPTTVKPIPKKPTTRKPTTKNPTTNNNSINNNNINNKSNKCIVEQNSTGHPFKEIIEYLNNRSGKNYRYTTKATQRHIRARFEEGFTLEDFKRVIDWKVSQWLGDKDMDRYLRPETLFGTKFESYLNESPALPKDLPEKTEEPEEHIDLWSEE